ncbi:MAG TPA: GAF domain-containing protein [Methylomirabilota bacterium]|nr:GAF domain-containing protein [Methylomirabilota bacterium]
MLEQLRRLQVVTDTALSHLSLDDLLQQLLHRVTEILEADTAAVLLTDRGSSELVARAARGLAEEVERGVRIPIGKGFAGRIAADRRPVVIEDVDHADVLNPLLREKGVRSLLGVPLLIDGQVIGVLHVGTLRPRQFTPDEVALLQLVADRIALAIDRARLYEAERRARADAEAANRQLRQLQLVTEAALAHLGEEELLQELLWRITEILKSDTAAVLMADEAGRELVARAARGLEEDIERDVRIPIGKGFAGRIAAERRPVVIEDVDDSEVLNPLLHEKGVRSLLGVPLLIEGRMIGVLHVGTLRPRRFTADEVALLQLVADRVALALDRARLEREARARAEAEAANRQLRQLQLVTEAALAHLNEEELLQETLSPVAEGLGADTALILLLDENGKELAMVRIGPGLEEEVDRSVRIPVGRDVAGHIAAEGKPLIIEDVDRAEILKPFVREQGVRSLLGVPLLIEERLIGILQVGSLRPRRFTPDEADRLQLMADRIALAIDRIRLYQAERKARDDAQAANRLKDEFLTTLSHELRTPLTSILGWARLLQSGKAGERNAERAPGTIVRSALALKKLIDDLLDMSMIVTGKLRLELQPVDLTSVTESALEAIAVAARAKEIRVETDIDSSAAVVLGDPTRLQQVFWNLLSNAVKFTPVGGRVALSVRRAGTTAEIRVSDTGEGISAEFLANLFGRFRQADSSATRSHGGLGLGLAIVRHLVEIHGGTVEAESGGPGQGATFTVRLPIATAAAHLAAGRKAPRHQHRKTPAERKLDGVKILAVEDDADTRDLLSSALSRYGATVKTAASAGEGLELLRRWPPDLLIVDIGMPFQDGYDFLRRARAELRSNLPAVALTAYAGTPDRERVRREGFLMHLAKPIDPAELVDGLAAIVSRTAP